MQCDELLKMLNEYVDGTLEPGLCEQFRHHLEGCNPCQVVVDNIRKTIHLYKNGEPYPLPDAVRSRLHNALRDCWQKRHTT